MAPYVDEYSVTGRYETEEPDSGDFYFDNELNLDSELEDRLVATELMRCPRDL